MAKRKGDSDLLERARKRFSRAVDAETENREGWRASWRFVMHGEQWDDASLAQRARERRPAITVNKLITHTRNVVNAIRQNRPAIKVLPVDDYSDPDTAEIFTGICRHIYHTSDGETATDTAAEHAVVSGWGYFRVMTVERDPDTKEQDIEVRRVPNPLSVYLDPASVDPTGADAKWGFIVTALDEEEAKERGIKSDGWPDDEAYSAWRDGDMTLLAEYFEKDEDGVFQWYQLTADRVLDRTEWGGSYIPIIRVVGNESHLDGKCSYWGMARDAMDAAKLYNLWATAEAEIVSIMPKMPYIMPAGAEEGFEDEWDTANTTNRPYVRYNGRDDQGNPIAPPQRAQPPVPPAGIIQAKIGASDDIKAVIGQYDASLGAQGNETSGRAILARQKQGAAATYHYSDNVARSMRQLGKVLVDLIPKRYDTRRIARIMGEDASVDAVTIDPSLPVATKRIADAAGKIERIYNPGVGRYDVTVTTGPSFMTRREEGAQMMTEALKTNPALTQLIGDLYFRVLDVPYADDIAKRMKAMLPPQIAQLEDKDGGEQIPPAAKQQIMQMQEALQAAQAQLQQAGQQIQGYEQQSQSKQGELQIKAAELELKAREIGVKEQEAQIKAADIAAKREVEMAKIQAEAEMRAFEATQAEARAAEPVVSAPAEPKEESEVGQASFALLMMQQLDGMRQQMACITQRIEESIRAAQTVSVKEVRDASGRLVGGVQIKADGTEVPITIQ